MSRRNTNRLAVEMALSRRCGASEKGNGFMENDRAGERGCARRAWAGHSADTGACEVAEEQSQRMDLLRQRAGHSGQSLLTGSVGEPPNEHAGSR